MSWHNLIRLGVLSSMFPAVDGGPGDLGGSRAEGGPRQPGVQRDNREFIPQSLRPQGGQGGGLVLDYMPINPYIEQPVHPFPSPDIVFQSVGKDSKWFAKLDALHGYYQIPLALESQKLTAFLLPQGRFYYRMAPMGLSPSVVTGGAARATRPLLASPGS